MTSEVTVMPKTAIMLAKTVMSLVFMVVLLCYGYLMIVCGFGIGIFDEISDKSGNGEGKCNDG